MNRNETLAVVGLGVLVLAGLTVAMDTHHQERFHYPPPIDLSAAPDDFSLITQGSSWRCRLLRDGKPTRGILDYRFSPEDLGLRWEYFSHKGDERPFFDLEHATGTEQYFAGQYVIAGRGKVQLSADLAGMTLAFSRIPPAHQEELRKDHDPWLRGEIKLHPNAWNGVFEELTFRTLSKDEMSFVAETRDTPMALLEQTCQRVDEPPFDPAASLALLKK